jgi:hypothetical protein
LTTSRGSDPASRDDRLLADQDSITIEQSALKQYGGLAFGLSGGMIFLLVALAWGSQQPIALVMFGLFGIFMLLGGLTSLRRGSDLRLIQVGPDGIWLPEMGRLDWSEIREVRLEVVRGVGGGGDRVTPYRRLGVEPIDPDIKPTVATQLGWGMFYGYAQFLKRLAPGFRFGGEDLAPFGLGEPEATPAQLDEAVAVVRRYAEVVDAEDERARHHAPRWAARPDPHLAAGPMDIGAIDARLTAGPSVAPVSSTLVPIAPEAPPAAVFRTPPLSPRVVWGWLLGLIPFAAFGTLGFGMSDWRLTSLSLVVLLVGAIVFLVPVVARLGPRALESVRHSRMPDEARTVLRVGPDGIWLAGLGTVPWDRVRAVRARVSGTTPIGVGGQIPRWGLFVEPEPGNAPAGDWAVYADQLDTPFDDVVDLVRYYHPVEETG